MAPFNPSAGDKGTTPDFTGSSKGIEFDRIRPDSSIADLFEGMGKGLIQGIEAIDTGIQEQIQIDVNEGMEAIDNEFGVGAATTMQEFSDMFDGKPVPQRLRNASKQLTGLQTAVAQGQLPESHYYIRAQSLVRQLRGKYPGYSAEIDTMIENVTGVRPANAIRKHMMSEWGEGATDAEKAKQTFVNQNIDTIVAASGENWQEKDLPTLQREQAIWQNRDTQIKRQEAEMVHEERTDARNDKKVRVNLRTRLTSIANQVLSQGMEQSDKQMGTSARQQIDIAIRKAGKGERISSEEMRQLSAQFMQAKQEIRKAFDLEINKTWADSDEPGMSYAKTLDPTIIQEEITHALSMLDYVEQALTHEQYGLLKMPVLELEAYKNDVTVSLLSQFDFSKIIAMEGAVGSEALNQLFRLLPSSAIDNLERVDAWMASEIQLGKMGDKVAADHIKQVREAEDVSDEMAGQIIDHSLKRWDNIVSAIGTEDELPMEMFLKEANYWFDKRNFTLADEAFEDEASKDAFFRRIAGPKVTEQMLKVRDMGETEIWDKYQAWVANTFRGRWKQPITLLAERVRTPDVFDVHWDPKANRFEVSQNPNLSSLQREGIRASGEVAEVEQAEASINQAIQLIAPIIAANDRDVPTELMNLFKEMGFNPDAAPHERTIVYDLMSALERQMKIVGQGLTRGPGPIVEGVQESIWKLLAPFEAPFRAPEERGELQGDQPEEQSQAPSNPALDTRLAEIGEQYPEAVATLRGRKDPPKFEELPWTHRLLLNSEAKELGVTPQAVIDRAHELANPKKAPPPVKKAAVVEDDPQATHDNNAMLTLLGNAEGTNKGDVYNETLGYGAFTGGDVDLVSMTLDQIDSLQTKILQHPGNHHNASPVGRYQFVRTRLRDLRKKMGLGGDQLFTPELQDRLAMESMKELGLEKWRAGEMSDAQFLKNLSREWASLPKDKSGRSYYGGRTRVSAEDVFTALNQMVATNPTILRQITMPGGIQNLSFQQRIELMEKMYG